MHVGTSILYHIIEAASELEIATEYISAQDAIKT